jgi:hypothetical protein
LPALSHALAVDAETCERQGNTRYPTAAASVRGQRDADYDRERSASSTATRIR